jgi:hypothetical protein
VKPNPNNMKNVKINDLKLNESYLYTDHEGYNRQVKFIGINNNEYQFIIEKSEFNSSDNDISEIKCLEKNDLVYGEIIYKNTDKNRSILTQEYERMIF